MPRDPAPDYFAQPERIAATRRSQEIARLRAYYKGTQYDGRPDFFTGEAANGEVVPVRERKPTIIYPLPKAACNQATRFTFGEGRFPQIAVAATESDDATTAVSDDEAATLTAFLAHVIELSRLKSAMRRLLRIGLSQRSAVAILTVRRGRFGLDMPRPEDCAVEFVDDDPEGDVRRLVWCYPFEKEVQRNGRVTTETYLFRRDYTESEIVVYEDAPAPAPGKDAEWVRDQRRSRPHGLGFCPVRWIRNLPAEDCADIDGVSLYEGLEDEFDSLNLALSQRNRGIVYFGTPQAWETGVSDDERPAEVARTSRPAKATTDPAAAKKDPYQRAGGERARKKAPDQIWSYQAEGAKVGVMETTGAAFDVASKHVLDVRARILEAIDVVLLDPMTVAGKGELSAKALAMMYAPLLALVDELRDCWWSTGLAPILSMILRITVALGGKGLLVPMAAAVAKIAGRFLVTFADVNDPAQGTIKVWVPPKMIPSWGSYFSPTNTEIGELVDATVTAKESGLITAATAARNVQSCFGETDTDDDDDAPPSSQRRPAGLAPGASHPGEKDDMDPLHMDDFDAARRLLLPEAQLARFRVKKIGALDAFEVWTVDGLAVRALDCAFKGAANPSRTTYVPEGELWIDQALAETPPDLAATALHAAIEASVMAEGVPYAAASAAACAMERVLRNAFVTGVVSAATPAAALEVAAAWLPGMLSAAQGLAAARALAAAPREDGAPSSRRDVPGNPDTETPATRAKPATGAKSTRTRS